MTLYVVPLVYDSEAAKLVYDSEAGKLVYEPLSLTWLYVVPLAKLCQVSVTLW